MGAEFERIGNCMVAPGKRDAGGGKSGLHAEAEIAERRQQVRIVRRQRIDCQAHVVQTRLQ